MGWATGTSRDGRAVGYGFTATCDHDGCRTLIDRGLAYVCGGMHDAGWEIGCGRYFCDTHRTYPSLIDPDTDVEVDSYTDLCLECAHNWEFDGTLACEECGHLGVKHDRRAEPKRRDDDVPTCSIEGCECEYWQPPVEGALADVRLRPPEFVVDDIALVLDRVVLIGPERARARRGDFVPGDTIICGPATARIAAVELFDGPRFAVHLGAVTQSFEPEVGQVWRSHRTVEES